LLIRHSKYSAHVVKKYTPTAAFSAILPTGFERKLSQIINFQTKNKNNFKN